jgi:hypothetical protein
MQITTMLRLCLLAAPLTLAAVPASAQVRPPDDSNVHISGMLNPHNAPKGVAPDVTAPPAAWPRLDPGSVICATRDDLVRRADMMRGEHVAPPNCRQLSQATAITILNRAGPGATEVQVTGRDQTGWTDAWLPTNPPLSTTPVSTH